MVQRKMGRYLPSKKGGGYMPCGRKTSKKGKYPKCVPASKAARMTPAQRKSAIRRKRAAGNPGGKPTMVKTFTKSRRRMRRGGKKKR